MVGAVCIVGFLAVDFYCDMFIRVIPPRSIRVVDAITGKPISGMNVCMQAVSKGWTRQALRSESKKTDSDGRAHFGRWVLHLALLQKVDLFSMQVTDPTSHFVDTCGPQVGLSGDAMEVGFWYPLTLARRDGTEHFPTEVVPLEDAPLNITWYPLTRGADFSSDMTVRLIPVLDDPEQCKQIAEPKLQEACLRANKLTLEATSEPLLPRYIAGMGRTEVQRGHGGSPGSRIYIGLYDRGTVPPAMSAIVIALYPTNQNASDHFAEIPGIVNCDPKGAEEIEPIPGERIWRTLSVQAPCAYWASENKLIILPLLRSSRDWQHQLEVEWLREHPASSTQR